MVATIISMILPDVLHPPAVATALAFAYRATDTSNLSVFLLALAVTASLVLLQRFAVWSLLVLMRREGTRADG